MLRNIRREAAATGIQTDSEDTRLQYLAQNKLGKDNNHAHRGKMGSDVN